MRKSGPPKGLIAYLVLELLEEKPRYGYEILKEIGALSGGHWEPSYGSVYPILYKFEEEGWAERIEREDEPDRKYFELTDAGREELADRRESCTEKARDFADVILGYFHVYAAFSTDERFDIPDHDGEWQFDEAFSEWIVEQVARHHERYFETTFERLEATPEEFDARHGIGRASGTDDARDREGERDQEREDSAAES
ncbi:PadR family transcriptional regulator [Natronolimnohabitans innermongolicus]|uniref:PadR family transcriptional regulator n=1 Tax=Natronolimnohabitans innermongolicus JCM 12255 TaxID=1227499 RepID=L9WX76_9EURY|nr:PadR family transcriptional regulator [Natronolimnohabitans innermongolicus]ELY54055.1 PadR family transcriptional regulator [Natronolimnohabitans innermongolicus JCM 12255]